MPVMRVVSISRWATDENAGRAIDFKPHIQVSG
jgi:hypothetical protein